MELVVLAALVLAAAGLIALPGQRRETFPAPVDPADALAEERDVLLAELRDLDDDAASGRIAAEDRQAGRRAVAPRLRELTEALRAAGVAPRDRWTEPGP